MPIHGLPPLSGTYPPHFNIESVIRPNILSLHPYRCARDDYDSGILLDANENALGHSISPSSPLPVSLQETLDLDLHRYPSPSHDQIKSRIAQLRGLPESAIDHVFLGVGSDEVIDLLMRVCVIPGKEKVMITPPTYGMYKVCAQVNDLGIVTCNLELGSEKRFEPRIDEVRAFVHPVTFS
jgi:histidinol-phosphate aminotransferase